MSALKHAQKDATITASEIEDFLLHHPEVAFLETDPAGTIQRIGAGLGKTLGIATEMYLGRPLDDLMKVEDVSRVKEAITGNLRSIILTLKNPGQPREGTYSFWVYRTSTGGRVLFGVLVSEVLKSLPLDTLRLMMEIDRLTREVHDLRTALEERSRRLEQMSVMDPLTGAYNRRYFLTLLETEWSRAVRYQYPVSLMGFDIDDFREVNERAGPDIGDSVLMDVTKAVGANLRMSDVLGRYEGAIFMALLPHNNAGRAYALADRLCEIIRGLPFFDLDGKPFHITASFGISEAFAGPGDSATHLVRRSLRALKQAKARGKNRVEIAHGL